MINNAGEETFNAVVLVLIGIVFISFFILNIYKSKINTALYEASLKKAVERSFNLKTVKLDWEEVVVCCSCECVITTKAASTSVPEFSQKILCVKCGEYNHFIDFEVARQVCSVREGAIASKFLKWEFKKCCLPEHTKDEITNGSLPCERPHKPKVTGV